MMVMKRVFYWCGLTMAVFFGVWSFYEVYALPSSSGSFTIALKVEPWVRAVEPEGLDLEYGVCFDSTGLERFRLVCSIDEQQLLLVDVNNRRFCMEGEDRQKLIDTLERSEGDLVDVLVSPY